MIAALIANPERNPTADEASSILDRIASASFNRRLVGVDPQVVGERFEGKVLGPREDSLTAHMAKRIRVDRQWSEDTEQEDFLGDIERSVSHPDAKLAVYERRNTSYAVAAAPNTVPHHRRGPESGDYIVVYYSANSGKIINVYQADDPEGQVTERARWIG